jgi:phage terminase Nu1 subunit (DNA packaging protein)
MPISESGRGLRPIPDELLTRQELAAAMRVSVRTIDAMRAEGMPAVTWGRRLVRFRLREAIAWAESHDRKAA